MLLLLLTFLSCCPLLVFETCSLFPEETVSLDPLLSPPTLLLCFSGEAIPLFNPLRLPWPGWEVMLGTCPWPGILPVKFSAAAAAADCCCCWDNNQRYAAVGLKSAGEESLGLLPGIPFEGQLLCPDLSRSWSLFPEDEGVLLLPLFPPLVLFSRLLCLLLLSLLSLLSWLSLFPWMDERLGGSPGEGLEEELNLPKKRNIVSDLN